MTVDVLVINLTRFGDLLQSQPLITDLHDSGHSVGLVCLENFAAALPLLRHVDQSFALPAARLMRQMDNNWHEAVASTLALARQIRQQAQPRVIINLTATLPARLLARLLSTPATSLLGFGLDAEGFGVNGGIWASVLCGASLKRSNAPFNLVDMFRKVGSPLFSPAVAGRAGRYQLQPPDTAAQDRASALLQNVQHLPAGAVIQGFVALQLGASEARRQWPVASFAALGDLLWQKAGLCPVLLGTPSEKHLVQAYAAASRSPFVDAAGQTTIPQLAALLCGTRLLVTNDTGTMHLAAGLGLPCLAFFLATAQPWDTGPYLPDCCCLEPLLPCHPCPFGQHCHKNHTCLQRISPHNVGQLLLARLRDGHWQPGLSPALCQEARVWLTTTDEHGFAVVQSLSGHGQDDRSLWLLSQRHFWRHLLDSLESQAPQAQPQAGTRAGVPAQPQAQTQPQPQMRTSGSRQSSPLEGQSATPSASADTGPQAAANAGPEAIPAAPEFSSAVPPAFSPAFKATVVPVLDQAARLLDMLVEQAALTGRSATAGQLFLRNCQRLQNLLSDAPALSALACFWRELRQQRGNMDDLRRVLRVLARHIELWSRQLNGEKTASADQ